MSLQKGSKIGCLTTGGECGACRVLLLGFLGMHKNGITPKKTKGVKYKYTY